MTAVLGMTVNTKTNQLWICGAIKEDTIQVQCVFQYNLKDGKLIHRYPDTSRKAKLFNDVAIAGDGSVYVTDSYTKSLYKIDTVSKSAVLYLEHNLLQYANGIKANGNILYVSAGNSIARVNTADKGISTVELENWLVLGNDGLYFYKNSLVGIQNVIFPPVIARYYFNDSGTKMIKGETLAAGHPSFVIPTTGVIVDDEFYFMGNNNLKAKKEDRKKITVMKIRLTTPSSAN
jgi:hypothetical protein